MIDEQSWLSNTGLSFSFGMELSSTSYFRNALSVGIQLSPEQIVRKLDALDQREHGDEALEELGTWFSCPFYVLMLIHLKVE